MSPGNSECKAGQPERNQGEIDPNLLGKDFTLRYAVEVFGKSKFRGLNVGLEFLNGFTSLPPRVFNITFDPEASKPDRCGEPLPPYKLVAMDGASDTQDKQVEFHISKKDAEKLLAAREKRTGQSTVGPERKAELLDAEKETKLRTTDTSEDVRQLMIKVHGDL